MPYCRCKQTAFKRAVLLQLSQPSTESAEHEQSVRRNMSQYVTTCHDMSWYVTMSPVFNRPFLWRVGCTAKGSQWCGRRSLQKNWWCKSLQEILIRGISWILYYFHPKNISGHYRKIWGKTGVEAQIIYIPYWYTILLMCNCFWCIPNHSKDTAAELYGKAL